MFFSKAKRELCLLQAFQKLFYDEDGKMKEEAQTVLSFLRDEAGARGELGVKGIPYFYDSKNRFDPNAAAFLLGKRRMFDLIIKYLALDEKTVFNLAVKEEDSQEALEQKLDV